MNSFSKVKPDIPTETKHGLTHVVQMRHLKHFGYSALSLAISFSHLVQDIHKSLQDEANALFWLWHFKVLDANEATVSNHVERILACQKHAW